MTNPPNAYSYLQLLVQHLGGDVDAWIADESACVIPHGPVTISSNQITAMFHLPSNTARSACPLSKNKFRVSWQSRPKHPITALCALFGPRLPGEARNSTVHVMDASIPISQLQSSETAFYGHIGDGWFVSPPALQTGFVQLEICKAVEIPNPHLAIYVTDHEAVDYPPIIFRFNLLGIPPGPEGTDFFDRSHCRFLPSARSVNIP
ncbi:hypothetical protein C8R44DRAFT_853668 [Mycena epipterygia]|nr:hypothetical protein C8R44DRAFT_853668 [Mycena epipterygia]